MAIDLDMVEQEREAFLRRTRAQLTPAIWFAAWLMVFRNQGGRIQDTSKGNYQSPGVVLTGGIGTGLDIGVEPVPSQPDYGYKGFRRWTPTTWAGGIPAGYGSLSLELFVIPDLFGFTPTSDLPYASGNTRPGWQWGHTEVFILRKHTDGRGLHAWTNKTSGIYSFRDVDALMYDGSAQQLLEQLEKQLGISRRPRNSRGRYAIE